jgi:DNA-binding beta-propeller fold protein YncE
VRTGNAPNPIPAATHRSSRATRRRAVLSAVAAGLLLPACSKPAGVLFETADTLIVWPPPPDAPRVRYVGQLRSADDLHASRTALQEFGRAVFGPGEPVGVLLSPIGVCTDNARRVFIADRAAGLVHVYDLDSRRYESLRPPVGEHALFEPVSVAYDPAGRLFVSDPGAGVVHVFQDRGAYLGTLGDGQLARPVGLAFDAARQLLYIADTGDHRVVVLTMQDTVQASIGSRGSGPGQFNFPTFVSLAPDGRLFVADTLNCRVQIFSPDGAFERSVGSRGDLPGYFSQPKGLAADAEGRLFVVDANFEAVQIFNDQGQVLMSFGQEGHGPGEFWLPVDLRIDESGRLWVADSYNRRVQVFEIIPPEATPAPEPAPEEQTP